jgi:hypothetical protein
MKTKERIFSGLRKSAEGYENKKHDGQLRTRAAALR